MIELGKVSLEWGTMMIQLVILLFIVAVIVLPIVILIKWNRHSKINELERRIEALERERLK